VKLSASMQDVYEKATQRTVSLFKATLFRAIGKAELTFPTVSFAAMS